MEEVDANVIIYRHSNHPNEQLAAAELAEKVSSRTVSVNEEDEEDDDHYVSQVEEQRIHHQNEELSDMPNIRSYKHRIIQTLAANITPDDLTHIKGSLIFESIMVVRLLKFVVLTTLSIIVMHSLVRSFHWEHDIYYSLNDFFYYDFGEVVLKTAFLGVLGRVHEKKGCDRLSFMLPLLVSSIATSASTNIKSLQNSITFYNVSCTWSWSLYIFAGMMILIVGWLYSLHMRNVIHDGKSISHILEILLLVLVFIVPKLVHGNVHIHHYYSFWLLGMIFNRREWYDELMFTVCVGQFVNGIAVYGLDPVLTCSHALYESISNHCVFVRADEKEVELAKTVWGSEWIENMLGNGTDVCFGYSAF